MSIRHEILSALKRAPMTTDELVDAMPNSQRGRLIDNVGQAAKEGLLSRSKDDVTGKPLYSITKAGIERLNAGVGSPGGKAKNPAEKKQAVAEKKPMSRIDVIGQNGNELSEVSDLSDETELPFLPMFWVAFSRENVPCVISKNKEDCIKQAESMAMNNGCGFVCAVIAKCEFSIKWEAM